MVTKKHKKKLPLRKKLVGGYLFCMFTIFPVFCTDGYFNIRHDRYYFYLILSVTALVLQGVLLALGSSDQKNMPHNLLAVHAASKGPWYRRLSFTDWFMLVLVICAAVSTFLSQYPLEAILGSKGRNNGLVLLVVYGGVYFLITRCYEHMDGIFVGLASCAGFVSLMAVLNFFYLDPLRMHDQLSRSDSRIFISTIGNINLLSSYLCIVLPATVTLFVHTKGKGQGALYLLSSALGFAALMCADSDSGILGMGAFGVMGLLLYIREPGKLKKYLLALSVMFLAAKGLGMLMDFPNKGMGIFQQFFVSSAWSTAILIVLALATGLLYLLHWKKPQMLLPTAVRSVFVVAVVIGVLALAVGIVYCSVLNSTQRLDAPWSFLRLDDSWGTHRGFMWRRSVDIFRDFSWKEKLFGSGPDTFYLVFQPYFGELSQYGETSTNAAHNEYLNILITQGLVGLTAYLAVILGSLLHALRCAKRDPYYLVFAAGVLGYSVQALVNVAQPITTPLFFLFLSLAARKLPKKEPKKPPTSYRRKHASR